MAEPRPKLRHYHRLIVSRSHFCFDPIGQGNRFKTVARDLQKGKRIMDLERKQQDPITVQRHERNDVANIESSFVAGKEAILLASARAGDSAAFETLVMPHRDALLRVTWRILRNREDAEDAVQTAFLDAFRNLNGFQGRSQFSSWLTRIAMNAALMRLRVNRREPKTSLDEVAETGSAQARFHPVETRPNPEQEYMSKEGRDLLEKGLKKLRPLYVEVLRLHSLQDLSAKEAADILEVPVGTVKARLLRARVQLIRYSRSMLKHKRSPMQGVGALISRESGRAFLRDVRQL